MTEQRYFVADSQGGPFVGLMPAAEIRRRLADGSLRPTSVCLPAGATGDVSRQWRPVGQAVGPYGSAQPAASADEGSEPRAARWAGAGLLAAVAVCALGAAAGSGWLLWRALTAPPAAPEPAEYTDYEVAVTGRWLLIRNTGPDPLFTGSIRYRVARNDGTAGWYDGDQAFLDWMPGEDVVVFLPAGVPARRVVVEFTGTAQKVPAGPEYRLRYGPAAPPPVPPPDVASAEEVGFDPDLAAATDGQAEPKR